MKMVSKSKWIVLLAAATAACTTAYKAQPLSFRLPSSYANVQEIDGAMVAADAYADANKAKAAFGFDARGAGLLPVQVVFDNQGTSALHINPGQTFLIDGDGNLWPILEDHFAYERVTKYAETNEMFREGAYRGALGTLAGAVIGAAVGVVSGENVGTAAGKGAAAGLALGSTIGGSQAISSDEAERRVMKDFRAKSLKNRDVEPGMIAYGFLFFPGEAKSASMLRLQLADAKTGKVYTREFPF
jgi:hypothetical protein